MEVAPKRILYVITKANWGGAQRYVFRLATHAKSLGYEVLVVSGTEGVLTEKLRDAGIAVSSIITMKRDIRLTAELHAFVSLYTTIRTFRPDVVHANSSKAGGLASLAARLCGVRRIIFTAHAWAHNEGRPLYQKVLIGLFHYVTVLLAHTTICVSEAIQKQSQWMPFVRNRLQVIHNGIFAEPLLDTTNARARLLPVPVSSNTLVVGTIAELHPTKGLDVLIRAFSSLTTTAHLVLVGTGDERDALETLARESAAADRIHFTGFVPNASELLRAFDIFVLPSRSEAFGMVLLEAGLASLPVIASNVGGIPEIIRNEESGLLVEPNDATALTLALDTLLTNAQARTSLGNALYERVTRVFTEERMLRETFSLYTR